MAASQENFLCIKRHVSKRPWDKRREGFIKKRGNMTEGVTVGDET